MKIHKTYRIAFVYAEREGWQGPKHPRPGVDGDYNEAVVVAAMRKPKIGLGERAESYDYVVLVDGDGAWGAGALVRAIRTTSEPGGKGHSVVRALVDPTDVTPEVWALVQTGFKPEHARNVRPALLLDGQVRYGD